MTEQRLDLAKTAINEIIGDKGCLLSVLDDRMAARGFTEAEATEALDAIAATRLVHIRPFTHPKLGGQLVVSFQYGKS